MQRSSNHCRKESCSLQNPSESLIPLSHSDGAMPELICLGTVAKSESPSRTSGECQSSESSELSALPSTRNTTR